MNKRLALLALGVMALALPATPARSTVIWTFYESSCTHNPGVPGGGSCAVPPPGALAELTLPDINSSGSWSFFYNSGTMTSTETGDTDFAFHLNAGARLAAPNFHPTGVEINIDITYNIAFASSPSSLAIGVSFFGGENNLCIRGGLGPCLFQGSVPDGDIGAASENNIVGCLNVPCSITGAWILAAVPEPSSVSSLMTMVVMLLGIMLWWRQRHHRSGEAFIPLTS